MPLPKKLFTASSKLHADVDMFMRLGLWNMTRDEMVEKVIEGRLRRGVTERFVVREFGCKQDGLWGAMMGMLFTLDLN